MSAPEFLEKLDSPAWLTGDFFNCQNMLFTESGGKRYKDRKEEGGGQITHTLLTFKGRGVGILSCLSAPANLYH